MEDCHEIDFLEIFKQLRHHANWIFSPDFICQRGAGSTHVLKYFTHKSCGL